MSASSGLRRYGAGSVGQAGDFGHGGGGSGDLADADRGQPGGAGAMSSPAAAQALAYSPWVARTAVDRADRQLVTQLFEACGATDEIAEEPLLDHFTAMTGPVPGFVAFFAEAMINHATAQGIPPEIADRAIRQLFLASGQMLAEGASAAEHVQGMVDYAGTTAAGLEAMRASPLAELISAGLTAAAQKAREI